MISYVANAISLIASTIQNLLWTASFTGEVIISFIIWIFTVLGNLLNSITNFFLIVYEDNILIFSEIPNTTEDLAYSAYKQVLLLGNGIEMVAKSTCHQIEALFLSSKSFTNSMILMVSEVLKLLVNTALFMGETTWMIISFVPVQLPQLMRSTTNHLLSILISVIVDAYMKLLTFTNYLTEVPLESFLGIISAIVTVRLCVHFKDTIVINAVNLYWSVVRNVMYLYHLCYNYTTNPELQLFTDGDVMSENAVAIDNTDDANNGADVMCVICQERQKCVLTLPCRHICLCTECCRRLYGYQRTCPICRTFIYHSVTVYL